MQIIKCYNCENEISETEIVCPYCDYPVSSTKKRMEEQSAALSGETVKIATSKDFEKEKAMILGSVKEEGEQTPEDIQRAEKEKEYEIQSETLRRSLEERRAQRVEERRKQKSKKGAMVGIVALIIVGAFVVIYLVNNLVTSFVRTTKTSTTKKAKKEKVISSDASNEVGFRFHSNTLTILDQTIIMDGFDGNEEDKPWSEHSTEVVYLTVGSEVTNIGSYSFDDLTNLEQVTLADSVAVIGEGAFYGCSYLEEVAIKSSTSSLKTIGNHAFTNCESLEKISLGKEVVRIGDGAFSGCDRLGEITIPDSVTEIGEDAFFGCHNLIIACNKDSFAYKYATENSIEVKVLDEEEEIVVIGQTTEETEGESETNPSNSDESSTTDTKTSETTSQTSSKEETIEALQDQLANAQTVEEKDKILQEIDKAVMGQ